MAVTLDIPAALVSWRTMNKALETCDENACKDLLQAERTGKRRQPFIARIYGRYSTLRAQRERAELANA